MAQITCDDLPPGYWLIAKSTGYFHVKTSLTLKSAYIGQNIYLHDVSDAGMSGGDEFEWTYGPHGYMPEDFWL